MTSQPFQPTPPSPSYDEADVLALVEGLPLPAERAARLREALANDPQLAELVTLLRADRDAISLPTVTVSAPADLLDRVEAQLERNALVGLARNESTLVEEEIPVSVILPPRRVFIGPRVGGVLAAAAAVALIAGGVLMMVPGKGGKAVPSVDPSANNPHTPGDTNLANNATKNDGAADGHSTNAGTDVAANTPSKTSPDATAELPTVVQPDGPAIAAATGPTMEELLAAAQEGRLVLRLRTDEKTAQARVDDLNNHGRAIRVQALGGDRSMVYVGALADAMRPKPVNPAVVKPGTPDNAPAIASDNGAGTSNHPKPNLAKNEQPEDAHLPAPEFASQSFVATLPAAAESLESLRKVMNAAGGEWKILRNGVRVEPPTDTASILWWTAPTPEWGPRFVIPVVVQTN
ncbi:MAG: hypothetical protein QM783_01180 [Phycisphaerales bacterium]